MMQINLSNRCPHCDAEFKTIYGYSIEHLCMVAKLLYDGGYSPEHLHEVMQNLGNAYEYCFDHLKATIESDIDNFLVKFSIDPEYTRR